MLSSWKALLHRHRTFTHPEMYQFSTLPGENVLDYLPQTVLEDCWVNIGDSQASNSVD